MILAELLPGRLNEWRPSGEGRHSWSETDAASGWTVHITADRNDSLGCLAWEIELSRPNAVSGLTLRTWAERIAGHVGGFLEDLKLLEVDDTLNEAILRSDEPTRRGAEVTYYEVRLTGLTRAVVRRFKADTSIASRREQISFAVTHEAIGKFVGKVAG